MATEASCPICLASSEEHPEASFVTTPCNHTFCTQCIERVLLRPRHGNAASHVPTRGPCPMCRESVSLFDLEGGLGGVDEDVTSWPIRDASYSQRSLIPMRDADAILAGMIDKNGAIEGYSIKFCFREPVPTMEFSKPLGMALAFNCDATETTGEDDSGNGPLTLETAPFDGARFHRESMTFCGKVRFVHPVRCERGYYYHRLECLLHFSDGGNYIRRGNLRWQFASPPASQRYPLDGKWEVQWGHGESIVIYVQRHFFTCFREDYQLVVDEDTHCPRFAWNADRVEQTSSQQILPGSDGPGIGETLEWTTDAPGYERIVWKRLETDLTKCWKSTDIKPPGNFVYQRCQPQPGDDGIAVPKYHPNSLWGNTFCQLYTVGLASYHFLEPDSALDDVEYKAYISYENPRTEMWPSLDNGQSVPSRVPFRNIQWDPETRTFKGDICWEADYGTTWVNEPKWSYEIVFDPSFVFVQSGRVRRTTGPDHQFGEDLVYINAALETPLREKARTTQSNTGEYLNVIRKWRDDDASSSTLDLLGNVAMAVIGDRESMFDFNL